MTMLFIIAYQRVYDAPTPREPHLQKVHNKVKNEQKAGGKEEPIQKQAFDYAVRVCGRYQCLHQLVEAMAHRSCNKQPVADKKGTTALRRTN